jgi:NTE family protein
MVLSTVERQHDFVLYVAEAEETAWKHVVGRQVDRLFRVGLGDRPAAGGHSAYASGPCRTSGWST